MGVIVYLLVMCYIFTFDVLNLCSIIAICTFFLSHLQND